MTTTNRSAALVSVVPVFTSTERLALAGFVAGYSGLTREAYELDLRQYASWCHQHYMRLFEGRHAGIEDCLISFVRSDHGCSPLWTAPGEAEPGPVFAAGDRRRGLRAIGSDETKVDGRGQRLPVA
jgi:hypothetical protein